MYLQTVEVKIAGYAGFTENCYLISKYQADTPVIVVDPGDEADLILQTIGSRQLIAIVLTHGHPDHIGAVAKLAGQTGADVYAHALDAQRIEDNYQQIKGGFIDLAKAIYSNKADSLQNDSDDSQSLVTKFLDDGDLIELGGLELKVIHTPGHTPGGICLYSASDDILITGDTLFSGTCGRTDLAGGSPQDMHDSLQRLSKLPPQTIVYSGHGPTTTIANELNRGLSEY